MRNIREISFGQVWGVHSDGQSPAVVRVTPAGMTETLLTGGDGLDGPSFAAFGVKNHKKDLYVAN